MNHEQVTSSDRGGRQTVLFVQPYVPLYRQSFYDGLTRILEKVEIDVVVLAGEPTCHQKLRRDALDSSWWMQNVKQYSLRVGSSEFIFRRVPLKYWHSDLVILEQAVKNLDTWILIGYRKLRGLPTASWGHGFTITKRQPRWVDKLQQFLLLRSDWFFAYTPGSATRAVKAGFPASRIVTLHNTVDVGYVEGKGGQITSQDPWRDEWVAAFIGGLDESKNIPQLIEVARSIYAKHPSFVLVILGRGACEELIARHVNEPWLKWLGYGDQATKAMVAQSAKVLLIPGRIGLIAAESLQLGIPIIALKMFGHAPEFEYLTTANSLVVPDLRSLEKALSWSIDNPDKLNLIAAQAKDDGKNLTTVRLIRDFARGIRIILADYTL